MLLHLRFHFHSKPVRKQKLASAWWMREVLCNCVADVWVCQDVERLRLEKLQIDAELRTLSTMPSTVYMSQTHRDSRRWVARCTSIECLDYSRRHEWNSLYQPYLSSFYEYQGSHSFTEKNPGLSRTPIRIFPAPSRSPRILEYQEKWEKITIYSHYSRVWSIAVSRNCIQHKAHCCWQ